MEAVNGNVFKEARLGIRRKSGRQRGTTAEPARGTIEWLSIVSGCSIRTIKSLEKGHATIETIDKVSPFLRLNGRQHILGYGAENIFSKADGSVDFRPSLYPFSPDKAFNPDCLSSVMVMTLDPITFLFQSVELSYVYLEKITANLSNSEYAISFDWLYEVSLTPNAQGWLGIQKETHPFRIELTEEVQQLHLSIMFKQINPMKITWGDFVTYIRTTTNPQLKLEVNIQFTQFTKQFTRFVSIDYLKTLFLNACQRRKLDWPVWVQCSLLGETTIG